MPDLTPLEAAEKLENTAKWLDDKEDFGCGQDAMLFAASYLRKIASGEYAPVVHGRWIHKDCNGIPTENHEAVDYAECSNCGHTIHNVDQEAEHCIRCGALMDESRDGNSHDGKDDSHE